MIKVSVLYPHSAGVKFDMSYYLTSHMPMVRQKIGAAIKGTSVDQGLGGAAPGAPPAYVAMGHMLFESVDAFQLAMAQHGQAIMADVPNYTNAQPTILISEVKS